MKEQWVFFDLDGTLTRSEEGIWNCAKYAAEKMGFPLPEEEVLKKWIGPPLMWSFRNLMGMTEEQAQEAQKIYDFLGLDRGLTEYHIREGAHGLTREDWLHYLDFADKHLKR